MSNRKDNNNSGWKVFGGVLLGAIVGVGAGILGSVFSNDTREKDILDLRKRSKIQIKGQQKEQEGSANEHIYTQIDSFHCPITQEIMEEPMILSGCSHSFERMVIVEWLEKHGDCPMCKAPASLKDLKPNYSLKNAIQEIKTKTIGK